MISLIHSLTTSNLESNLQIQKKEKVSDEGLNYDVKTKTLYRKKKDYDGILILLRSLSDKEAEKVLHDMHSGTCGAHQPGPKLHDRIQ